ncbi:HD-GYP domain-containing protein [Sphingomonas immobilis]|uniref:HD-GYP domain-containing protein n=1 Tax=Sphingomonas immobilis TaxID=3063997 RepID=A0ABT9A3P4_9SPHN|nr:HD-GYP domain-containing protein [Sphingomonas sp. CA1-15]MDO7844453.1 HD-GYP domain-containing protein [Sphingomonas sp. CA1-15]
MESPFPLELAATHRALGAGGVDTGIFESDWRGADVAPEAPAPAPEKRERTIRLYKTAKKGTPAEERRRAAEIVAAARTKVIGAFEDLREGKTLKMDGLTPLVEAIAASVIRDPSAIPAVTRLKARHEYTYLHSIAVCGLMVCLAHELDLDEALIHEIGVAGLLHDIGKARVPNLLLDKPGPLTPEEFAVVRTHTVRGHELLRHAGIKSEIILDVCRHHHERIDGRGYPYAISGDALSLYARMGAVCDVFDAVTSARSYKKSWTQGEAIAWMRDTEGQFDRRVLAAFTRMIGPLSEGTLVRLASERLGLIVALDPADPVDRAAVPRLGVVVFHCAASNRPLPLSISDGVTDAIVSAELPSFWRFENWGATKASIFAFLEERRAAAA